MDSCIVGESCLNSVLQKQIDPFFQSVLFLFGSLHSVSTEVTMEMFVELFELNLSLVTECASDMRSGLHMAKHTMQDCRPSHPPVHIEPETRQGGASHHGLHQQISTHYSYC